MKNIVMVLIIILTCTFVFGCTAKRRARKFGGTATVELPCNYKLFDVTWKGDNIWYAVKKMRQGDQPESYDFIEDSSWGAFEGKVVFKESMCK